MELKTTALFGASILAFSILPSCVIDASGSGANSQYEPCNSPARVNRLNNGNYLVSIDGKVLSFN